MRSVFNQPVDLRDRGINRRVPILMRNDARVMPRPSGAGLGQGPWLHPAMGAYAVPMARRLDVSEALIGRMGRLIAQLTDQRRAADRLCNLHVVDTMGLADVTLADAGSTGSSGSSGDWATEIHLTRAGYCKCTAVRADALNGLTVRADKPVPKTLARVLPCHRHRFSRQRLAPGAALESQRAYGGLLPHARLAPVANAAGEHGLQARPLRVAEDARGVVGTHMRLELTFQDVLGARPARHLTW